jgi:hypothetical protein
MAKPSIAVILGGKGPKPPESEPDMDEDEGEESDTEGSYEEAAQEFADSLGVQLKDAKKFWDAFTALHRLEHVQMDKEDEGGEEESDEEK